jgi:hypothetical protein
MNWRLYLFSLIGLVFAVALLGAGLVAFRFTDPQKSGVSNALLPLLLSGAMATCSPHPPCEAIGGGGVGATHHADVAHRHV